MKKLIHPFMVLLVLASALNCYSQDSMAPSGLSLAEQEINDLLAVREEEKLARDVYLYAHEKYGVRISARIAQSEQRHMDRVLGVLKTYKIPDPASSRKGVFHNHEFQKLYDSFVVKVDLSLLDALIVGATIEDLDIRDINEFKSRTDKQDIIDMYNNLTCGSRNHLRAYYRLIKAKGGSYGPQYVSQNEFDAIINSRKEKCCLK